MAVLLVAYDVSDDDKRLRLARALIRLGYSRIQRSVYVHPRAYRGLKRRTLEVAARLIDPRSDRVLVITMPESVYEGAVTLGAPPLGGEGYATL
ncbi:MAG: CRISPR-associated endonuclease Cas2 [Desulfurococcales archaeon]|nr:CRISPR-associated endonuclease Cas2 [Desulfurococcales archaeon]